jgi:hypothetical protein
MPAADTFSPIPSTGGIIMLKKAGFGSVMVMDLSFCLSSALFCAAEHARRDVGDQRRNEDRRDAVSHAADPHGLHEMSY